MQSAVQQLGSIQFPQHTGEAYFMADQAFVKAGDLHRRGGLHIDTSHMKEVQLQANRIYVGNVNMLHESMPVAQDCSRTLVRITLPETFVLN